MTSYLNRALKCDSCCSAGQLTVEGGNCTYPQGMACSSILRPQPITCLALPPVCHRGREPGCGYQACCEPQMCCLHSIPSQADLTGLEKSQLEATICNSSCIQPARISASLHQNQQHQRCWDPDSLSQCPPPSSPVPVMGPIQLSCSRGSTSLPQAAASQPHSATKTFLYRQNQREPDSLDQPSADQRRPGQCQGKLSPGTALQQDLSHIAADREAMTEEIWEDRYRVEEARGQVTMAASRELLDEELQQDRREQSPIQHQQLHVSPAAELRKEQPRNTPPLMLRGHRDGKVRALTSQS